jgi:probable addiction module antidote protein
LQVLILRRQVLVQFVRRKHVLLELLDKDFFQVVDGNLVPALLADVFRGVRGDVHSLPAGAEQHPGEQLHRSLGTRRLWKLPEAYKGALIMLTMSKHKTKPWNVEKHLKTDADMVAYLEAALEEGDAELIATALGDIARARGMAQIAQETGLGRESLYKALSPNGNPEFATILKVVRALGLCLKASAIKRPRKKSTTPSSVS